MRSKKIDIACLLETKWRGWKANKFGERNKLLYSSANETRNHVEIVIIRDSKNKIVNAVRIGDKYYINPKNRDHVGYKRICNLAKKIEMHF